MLVEIYFCIFVFYFKLVYSIPSTGPNEIKFYLYNDNSQINLNYTLDPNQPKTIKEAKFVDGPFKVLIHGYHMNGSVDLFPQNTKNAYLEESLYNIIVVDWGTLANSGSTGADVLINYNISVSNVPKVANRTSDLLTLLRKNGIIKSNNDIHIIGFSLGGHISGIIGLNLRTTFNESIFRITGLDPAGVPYNRNTPNEEKLDITDAYFVDVIHTAAGTLGYRTNAGHVDFWPNGGTATQPNCPFIDLEPIPTFCSHLKAAEYFTLSIKIKNDEFLKACKCDNYFSYNFLDVKGDVPIQ